MLEDLLPFFHHDVASAAACFERFDENGDGLIDLKDMKNSVAKIAVNRANAAASIVPAVGLTAMIDVGAAVAPGDPLCLVHAASEADADRAIAIVREAIYITDSGSPEVPVVLERVAR